MLPEQERTLVFGLAPEIAISAIHQKGLTVMQSYHINAGKVAHETIDDETIMINFDTGAYYSTDQLGMEIWESLKSGNSLARLHDMIARRYKGDRETIEKALNAFLQEMAEEGLILATESNESTEADAQQEPSAPLTPFHPPVL